MDDVVKAITGGDYPPDLADDTFDRTTRVMDWRRYIVEEVREVWPELTVRERVLCYLNAQDQANNEHWE